MQYFIIIVIIILSLYVALSVLELSRLELRLASNSPASLPPEC